MIYTTDHEVQKLMKQSARTELMIVILSTLYLCTQTVSSYYLLRDIEPIIKEVECHMHYKYNRQQKHCPAASKSGNWTVRRMK